MEKITVLMQVKNVEIYIKDCLESILNQSYSGFKLLIIDDKSKDNTVNLIKSYNDPRVTIVTGTKGYIENLNNGIQYCDSEFIARMDGDDMMHPSRLEKQLTIMETKSIDLCSSWMTIFGEVPEPYLADSLSGQIDNPLQKLYNGNFVYHPTVTLRKSFLMKNQLKYEPYYPTEDYKLWSEIAKKNGTFYVIPEALLHYRRSSGQLSIAHGDEMRNQDWRIRAEILDHLMQNAT